jgi:hypothetical protein
VVQLASVHVGLVIQKGAACVLVETVTLELKKARIRL